MTEIRLLHGKCEEKLVKVKDSSVDLVFLDPPFNQGRTYDKHNDSMNEADYWNWMRDVTWMCYKKLKPGGSLYFMQREKNVHRVMIALISLGFKFNNLIIWKKMSSAVPLKRGYNKSYQIIAFGSKGKVKTFNKLRIDLPLEAHQKIPRKRGVQLSDVWGDIRELTSGYYSGDEPLRDPKGDRIHKQQMPNELIMRIILSSTMPGDTVLDPFAGTGTTGVIAKQLGRKSILIEQSERHIGTIAKRIADEREVDDVSRPKIREYYRFTDRLDEIWSPKI